MGIVTKTTGKMKITPVTKITCTSIQMGRVAVPAGAPASAEATEVRTAAAVTEVRTVAPAVPALGVVAAKLEAALAAPFPNPKTPPVSGARQNSACAAIKPH
jgi:hypothetical protein